jgi:hypothetical protein
MKGSELVKPEPTAERRPPRMPEHLGMAVVANIRTALDEHCAALVSHEKGTAYVGAIGRTRAELDRLLYAHAEGLLFACERENEELQAFLNDDGITESRAMALGRLEAQFRVLKRFQLDPLALAQQLVRVLASTTGEAPV